MSSFQFKSRFPCWSQSRLWVFLAAASCEGLRVGEQDGYASRSVQQTTLRSDEQLDKLLTAQLSWAAGDHDAPKPSEAAVARTAELAEPPQEAAGLMEASTDAAAQLREESKRLMDASVDSIRDSLSKRQEEIMGLQEKAQRALQVVREKQLTLQAASKKVEQELSDSAKIHIVNVESTQTESKTSSKSSTDVRIRDPAEEAHVMRFEGAQMNQLNSLGQLHETQQVMQKVMQEGQQLELKRQQEIVAGKQVTELKKQHENQLKKLDQLFKVQSHDLQEAQESQLEALKKQESFTKQAEEAAKQEALRRLEANSGEGWTAFHGPVPIPAAGYPYGVVP